MEASAISHLAICTRDMEKSLAFYRDMLGMKVLFDGPTPRKADALTTISKYAKAVAALVSVSGRVRSQRSPSPVTLARRFPDNR
jgi:catechol 2,3-dioxygenase-like lactoylglutathione lyase family enzyme